MRSYDFIINKQKPRNRTGVEAFPPLMLQMSQSKGGEHGLRVRVTYYLESFEQDCHCRPIGLPGILCYRAIQMEMFPKGALIHSLYQTFSYFSFCLDQLEREDRGKVLPTHSWHHSQFSHGSGGQSRRLEVGRRTPKDWSYQLNSESPWEVLLHLAISRVSSPLLPPTFPSNPSAILWG